MKKTILSLARTLIEGLVLNTIKNLRIQERMRTLVAAVFQASDALTDKDPNNEEQLKAIWREHRAPMLRWSIEELREEVRVLVRDPQLSISLNNALDEVDEGLANLKSE